MLIGLHGRKQAGKDTVYERIAKHFSDVRPVERASFADLLYESAAAALGIPLENLRQWKEDPRYTVQVHGPGSDEHGPITTLTFRTYLQRYGTEAHRQVFGTDFWVDQLRFDHRGKIVAVTDVRFENEAEAVRAAGGSVFHVVGPPEVENAGDGHASEEPLPVTLIDRGIFNNVRDDGFLFLDAQVLTHVGALLRNERP